MVASLRRSFVVALAVSALVSAPAVAQEDGAVRQAVDGLELRGIGPAFMGGRVADIAVGGPGDRSTWYVAVGSGGLWKTTNAGTTWKPVFDDQPSYSIGEVTVDPVRPEVVWVGTGENVSGRHVGWGDGVYRSRDGGRTWEHAGLEDSEHVGRILVDPRNPDVIYVAAEGPLWSSGGDRGVYKSTDGGDTWNPVLRVGEDTGVTDLEFAPGKPDVLYAAAYQRRRRTWALLAGGPRSGIYKSTDAGESWRKVTEGLPAGDMGKIGLAVTPADPSLVYATVEAGEGERGFYRSRDRGESWERRNSYTSGGTGPHYYQEIEASPVDPDLVYQMDVFLHVTRDGGKSFEILGDGRQKHTDNHALWIDPEDGDHLIAGTDGGLYETHDEGTTWRHFPNLPVSQFYHVAVSNSTPFYDVVGGTQDLGTLLGPARTPNVEGVRNQDWSVPLGADGYGVAFDPRDPSTIYMETQVGNLVRFDRRTGEAIGIQPQPDPGDPPERWNWDAPILVSPHSSSRLYFGSQRLWRSDDRGDSWTPVSGDLTRNQNRYELEIMGRQWSPDALWDNGAMSKYNTTTAISESPAAEGVLYVGTDDGLIQVSENGGGDWRRAAGLPGAPDLATVNDLQASLHDGGTVFAVADAHKTGDYTPYVYVSDDRGRSWRSIAGDLPDGTIAWAIEQDHEHPDLLFLGTEHGLYVSPNGGADWHELEAGVPTISFRDLALQREAEDLVGASFGRGFYVLDDYSPLRAIAAGALRNGTTFLSVPDAWWYVPAVPGQAPGMPGQGSTAWTAPNPPFGATFTYYLDEAPTTAREDRRARERELRKAGEDVPFPGWDRLRHEAVEGEPAVLLLVRDGDGEPVRWVSGPTDAGLHRVTWNLRRPPPDPVDLETPGFRPPWAGSPRGPLVAPGTYEAELFAVSADQAVRSLAGPREFEVTPVPATPDGADFDSVAAFKERTRELMRRVAGAGETVDRLERRLRHMRVAFREAPRADPGLLGRIQEARASLDSLRWRLSGDAVRSGLDEATEPSIEGRVGGIMRGHWDTRQEPTATQRRSLRLARQAYAELSRDLTTLSERIGRLEEALSEAGAPWTPGREVPPAPPDTTGGGGA